MSKEQWIKVIRDFYRVTPREAEEAFNAIVARYRFETVDELVELVDSVLESSREA